jgi:hypothetical protein
MKKYLLGIFAVILAIGMSAFTHQGNRGKPTTKYYHFDGTANTSLSNTQLWADMGSTPPSLCTGANVVCIVSSTEPTLTDFRNAITAAQPQSEQDLDNIDGVDIYSRKN